MRIKLAHPPRHPTLGPVEAFHLSNGGIYCFWRVKEKPDLTTNMIEISECNSPPLSADDLLELAADITSLALEMKRAAALITKEKSIGS